MRDAEQQPAETQSYDDEEREDLLEHPAIRSVRQTCSACPEQWEGYFHDGRAFYFRYRWGRATLAIGHGRENVAGVTAIGQRRGVDVSMLQIGDSLAGQFGSDEARANVFARLYDHEHGLPGAAVDSGSGTMNASTRSPQPRSGPA